MALLNDLKTSMLAEALNESDLQLLSGIVRKQTLYKDAIIFKENDPVECLYLLFEGKVAIERRELTGHRIDPALIQTVRRGQLIGEMGFVGGATRSATARAKSRVRLAVLPFDDLDALIQKDPSFGTRFLRCIAQILSRRLRRMNEQWIRASLKEKHLDEFEYF